LQKWQFYRWEAKDLTQRRKVAKVAEQIRKFLQRVPSLGSGQAFAPWSRAFGMRPLIFSQLPTPRATGHRPQRGLRDAHRCLGHSLESHLTVLSFRELSDEESAFGKEHKKQIPRCARNDRPGGTFMSIGGPEAHVTLLRRPGEVRTRQTTQNPNPNLYVGHPRLRHTGIYKTQPYALSTRCYL